MLLRLACPGQQVVLLSPTQMHIFAVGQVGVGQSIEQKCAIRQFLAEIAL
jgi:hypothetical protein